ncbi:MAG: hypothetical protein QXH80_02720 [Candidatus Nanoarchaeia archaeon]
METDNPQISAIIKIVSILKECELNFCLTGGLAVGVYASPRATEDIDIIIENNEDKKIEFLSKLDKDFKIVQHKILSFSFGNIWRIILKDAYLDNLIILDLIIANSQKLQDAISNPFIITISGLDIPIIKKEALINMKRLSSRLKDQADIESLTAENESDNC